MRPWIRNIPLPSEDKYGDHNLTPDELKDHPLLGKTVRVKGTKSPDFTWQVRVLRFGKQRNRVEARYPDYRCPRQWWSESTLEVVKDECGSIEGSAG